ncbi:unnamed protein product, partial [Scytosiphon promiscuus]
ALPAHGPLGGTGVPLCSGFPFPRNRLPREKVDVPGGFLHFKHTSLSSLVGRPPRGVVQFWWFTRKVQARSGEWITCMKNKSGGKEREDMGCTGWEKRGRRATAEGVQ